MMSKIIHYCWFGNSPIPENLRICMNSWKVVMPDWEWKRWDENSFDVNSTAWTAGAYAAKKYAFVSDYVRLLALYKFGGLYLDTDVKLTKSLEPLCRKYDAFMGFENKKVLTSSVIFMPAGHILLSLFLKHYDGKEFSKEIINKNIANVLMMTNICKDVGLICNDSEQDLIVDTGIGGRAQLHIFPQTYFCPYDFYHNKNFSENTYAIHYFDASWLDNETKKRVIQERSVLYKAKLKLKSKLRYWIKLLGK